MGITTSILSWFRVNAGECQHHTSLMIHPSHVELRKKDVTEIIKTLSPGEAVVGCNESLLWTLAVSCIVNIVFILIDNMMYMNYI